MPSSQYHLVQLHLLLCALLLVAGQRSPVRVPPQDLQLPNFGGESFERFGGRSAADSVSASSSGSSESQETSDEMREQLKQLLGDQLSTAFAPLATTPFTQRRPAIAAPASEAAARSQFSSDADPDQDEGANEEESPEEDGNEGAEEEEGEEATPQPQPLPPPLPQPAGEEEDTTGGQVEEVAEVEDYNAWRDNFYDLNEDGSYVFGYSIPHGVRRWERGFYSKEQHGQVVEGFYVQPRHDFQELRFELRCYRADSNGYQPLPVEFLRTPPTVRRDEVPRVNCFRNG
ncbi:uncharacterized protein LOC108032950 [Drosophila biarmipes]|uniref:uncharacterized protein LOC108032950 n=1 Tax=Drosophila biarmipes TaxID=125945 RepID=UPI0007E6F54A|nr:uncharacterized protein LOC108032950 [Drosophila biarmipes]